MDDETGVRMLRMTGVRTGQPSAICPGCLILYVV